MFAGGHTTPTSDDSSDRTQRAGTLPSEVGMVRSPRSAPTSTKWCTHPQRRPAQPRRAAGSHGPTEESWQCRGRDRRHRMSGGGQTFDTSADVCVSCSTGRRRRKLATRAATGARLLLLAPCNRKTCECSPGWPRRGRSRQYPCHWPDLPPASWPRLLPTSW